MIRFKNLKNQKHFTLTEALLVVAIVAILAGIVVIAINPGKQLGDTRNAQRQADVTTILNAVYQYGLDNNGTLPSTITATATELCKTGVTATDCTSGRLVDLNAVTSSGKYIAALPIDPQNASNSDGTGYKISKNATSGRVTVSAPSAEQSKKISVTH